MKITNAILTILFILFALVQVNDPDPWLWVALYLFVAIIAGMAFLGKYYLPLIWIGLLICLIKFALLLPSFIDWIQNGAPSIVESMKAEEPHIELTREFLGLLICILVLGFQYFQAKKLQHLRNGSHTSI